MRSEDVGLSDFIEKFKVLLIKTKLRIYSDQ